MKKIITELFHLYIWLKPSWHALMVTFFGFTTTCRYQESCSRYTLRQIQNHGTITGFKKGLRRVLSCYGYEHH